MLYKAFKTKTTFANSSFQVLVKNLTFFERHRSSLKITNLDSDGRLHDTNANMLEAFYVVSLAIAKENKPHTVGETLIKPCAKKMVEIVLGKEAGKKIALYHCRTIQSKE